MVIVALKDNLMIARHAVCTHTKSMGLLPMDAVARCVHLRRLMNKAVLHYSFAAF
jgi:hypothetical protein